MKIAEAGSDKRYGNRPVRGDNMVYANRGRGCGSCGRAAHLLLLSAALFFPGIHGRAEGYGDSFLYDVGRLPASVLADAIGFVVLYAPPLEGQPPPAPSLRLSGFPVYQLRDGNCVPAGDLGVDDTLPVGRGGWGGWLRFLLTARAGECLQIVIDPYADRRAWIRPNGKNGDYAVVYSDLAGRLQPVSEEIEIFLLSPETRLYADPRPDAKSIVLRKADSRENQCYYPVAFQGDFVQIGIRRLVQSHEEEVPGKYVGDTVDGEPIGWIRARDDRGRLAFHLFMIAWD